MTREYDALVIGAGVIGAAVTRSLLKRGVVRRVAMLEKEAKPALHTSGRNSGVMHSGFNLKPGSLKAAFCVEGNRRLRVFCEEKRIPFAMVGTVVVARKESEVSTLHELAKRADQNGVEGVRIVDQGGLKRLEPNAAGVAALHSPNGGITSGKQVTEALVSEVADLGGEIRTGERVVGIDPDGDGFQIRTDRSAIRTKLLFNCAGLQADRVAHLMGVGLSYSIVPFRGEYFKIRPEKSEIIKSMVYPVPDLAYPFLGVHWTKTIAGDVIIGPNATIALGRESYHPLRIHVGDAIKMVLSRNFRALFASREFRSLAWQQLKTSLSRARFVAEARTLVPNVSEEDFMRGKSGNRAQVVSSDGKMIEDILIERHGNALHVLNAVSPGFTCSLPFADYVVDQLISGAPRPTELQGSETLNRGNAK